MFNLLNVREILPDQKELHGKCQFLFDLPIEFGGSLDSAALKKAKDDLMVFDIRTGAD